MKVRVVANALASGATEDDYRIHCAALEWSLADPIIINSAAEIKSQVDWKDRVEPYFHQVQNLMRFCRRLPVTLLADDVGLGKTISAGLIVSELIKRGRVNKVFVICPKILIPQWIEELDSKFGISGYGAVGSDLRTAHQRAEQVIVTTYQSATRFLESQQSGLFDMLILDEAHHVRNLHGANQPPKRALAVFEALQARMFKYVLMLTATPIQNRLWDIYSLIDCLAVAKGHRNPFGSPEQFANRFVADGARTARRLNPRRGEEFRGIVASYMFRTRRVDAKLAFPSRQVQPCPVSPSQTELELQRLVADHIQDFNSLEQTSLLVALMSSPHALAAQIDNTASKRPQHEQLARRVSSVVRRIPVPAKTKAVLQIADDLRSQGPNWRMVVFTTRKETQRIIGKVLEQEGISCGFIAGGAPGKNRRAINAFRKDPPDVHVLVSTDAGAEGVNLQSANILVNYDLPWNPMVVEQRIGRVQRIGSKFKNVWVANVVHHNSPEQRIVGRLMEKLQVISHTVGDIESVLETSGDANGDSFEKQIRQMVVASLQGQDQDEAARRAEQSIDAAKKLFEQHQEEMDEALGNVNEQDGADAPMPELTPATPETPLEDFVVEALSAEGSEVEDRGDGILVMKSPQLGDERFTFDQRVLEQYSVPGVFLGRAPLLYQPGKPAFERLVQRWVDRAGALVDDQRTDNQQARQLAERWVSQIPDAQLAGAHVKQKSVVFTGGVMCRTRVANAVDSYEKLIRLDLAVDGDAVAPEARVEDAVNVEQLIPDLHQRVSDHVASDADIQKFTGYYEARLEEELKSSDSGEGEKKLIDDLRPIVAAEVSGLSGTVSDQATLAITYRFDEGPEYESLIEFGAGEVVSEPEFSECTLTGLNLPKDCLEKCSVTGGYALRHRLARSAEGGGYAMPDHLVTCGLTGKEVLPQETQVCCVSGKRCIRDALICSDQSSRYALPEYAVTCEITEVDLIGDEVAVSGLSGRRFRSDEAVRLADAESIAHKSEATYCPYSKNWHPSELCDVSEVTGQPVAKERLAYSEQSGKKCDVSEIRCCEQTGKRLLPAEVGKCEVTSKTLAKSALRTCPDSGKVASDALFEPCEVTGERVLPECLGNCSVTGKKARRTLLGKSMASGKTCLASKMVICEASGAKLLPAEAKTCSVTGKLADVRLLDQCMVTGRVALKSEMLQSKLSKRWMLKEHAKTLPSGTVVAPREVTVCSWSRKYLPVQQAAVCKLSGLPLAKSLLNESGEFAILRECLDGKHRGSPFPDPGFLARVYPAIFGGIQSFQWVSSPTGKAHVMFGKKSTFGFNSRVFAVVAHGDLSGLTLRGKALFGKRVKRGWQLMEETSTKGQGDA